MNDENTPGEWRVRVRYAREISRTFVNHPAIIVDCFVTAPDVNGFAYDAEILGDDEYHGGLERKLADCQLIAAAPAMREALRTIYREAGNAPANDSKYSDRVMSAIEKLAAEALAELDKPTV